MSFEAPPPACAGQRGAAGGLRCTAAGGPAAAGNWAGCERRTYWRCHQHPAGGRYPFSRCRLPECIAAASLANTALTAHARTLPAGDLLRVRDEVAILLRQKGHDVIVVAEALDIDALPELKDSTANGPKKDLFCHPAPVPTRQAAGNSYRQGGYQPQLQQLYSGRCSAGHGQWRSLYHQSERPILRLVYACAPAPKRVGSMGRTRLFSWPEQRLFPGAGGCARRIYPALLLTCRSCRQWRFVA